MRIPGREAPVLAETDVVVAGGGPAGLGAAIAAARLGARVVLCERYGFLGGNFTVASVGTVCGLYLDTGNGFDFVVGGIARELVERLGADGGGLGPVPFKQTAVFVYAPWAAKRLADHLVTSEPLIDTLLHALVADVVIDTKRRPERARSAEAGATQRGERRPERARSAEAGATQRGERRPERARSAEAGATQRGERRPERARSAEAGATQRGERRPERARSAEAGATQRGERRIDALVLATKRGPAAVRGKVFVDCTGDADIATFAGVPTVLGAPGTRQHASMQFTMQHVDDETAMAALSELGPLITKHGAHLSRDAGAVIPTLRPGEFLGAMTRVRNPDGSPIDVTDLRQATWGELEGRRLAEEAATFLRAHMPGFADAFLGDTATALGVRETRRIVGEQVLTGADVERGAHFPDAIATGAWPQEYHVAGRSTEYRFLPPGRRYQIPFASLRAREVENLLVAGRCISADHDALASTRVMGPSLALGQAAGTAAALAARDGGPVAAVDVAELQHELLARGAVLS